MVIDEFLYALGIENLPVDFQSLDNATIQSGMALLDVASLCSALTKAMDQVEKEILFFGAETVSLATVMQQVAEGGVSPLENETIQSVLSQYSASTVDTSEDQPSSKSHQSSVFTTAASALGDINEQSARLGQSWQQFMQDMDIGAFAQSLSDIGTAIAGDSDQLTDAQQEVMDFVESIQGGIGFFKDLQTVISGIGDASKYAASMEALMELPLAAVAAGIVVVGAGMVYLYQQWQAFEKGATDGLLYDAFTEFGELLVRIGAIWRYVMDEAIKSMLNTKSSMLGLMGSGLSDAQQQQRNQLEQKTKGGLKAYQKESVSQYQHERQEAETHARQHKSMVATTAPSSAFLTLNPPPQSALSALPAHGALTHRSPVTHTAERASSRETTKGSQFYINTINVTADSPVELASAVSQQAEVAHSRHVSTMMNYSRGKGVKP
ncbi:hypothetical protein MUU49_17470 [Scandinavium goeteborgense]|uniref:hypothetical protein n=1 Tax=Scandinavium goeteborgense TaxID=1851514 RepID=UPI0021651536|nr:hypothetical protein [Scandinavium goeteborgense]MCS2154348.1 hypothetical protein [Scandinavium goeteborgense]